MKNYLKSNRNHTTKYSSTNFFNLKSVWSILIIFLLKMKDKIVNYVT